MTDPIEKTILSHKKNRPTIIIGGLISVILFTYLTATYGWRQGALLLVGLIAGISLYHAAFGFTAAWREVVSQLHILLLQMMPEYMKMKKMIPLAVSKITLVTLLLVERPLQHHLSQEVLQQYLVILTGNLEVLKLFQGCLQQQTKRAFMQIQQFMAKDLWT